MQIRFDYTNMMADVVGKDHGIAEAELSALRERTRTIHAQIELRRKRGELPFFDLPGDRETVTEVLALAGHVQQNFDNVVVLGIGGSALGTTAIFTALGALARAPEQSRSGLPRLFVLDNVDPDGFSSCLESCLPERTCFIVISKSGSTVETNCQFLVARQWVELAVGQGFREHFILVTDPETGLLRDLARREGYRSCSIPSGVGGRFSVFTPVGLLPLACAGVDVAALLKGAASFAPRVCHDDLETNPAYLNAALQFLAYGKGLSISVLMPYSDRLRDLADWFRQLWAESLGKRYSTDGRQIHVGPTPVNALGATDQHSQVQLYVEGPFDKVVTFIAVDAFDHELEIPAYAAFPETSYLAGHSMGELIRTEHLATASALTHHGRPNCTLHIDRVSPETVGALIYLFEVQTLFAGALFDVDPLDQPGVEEGKLLTYALMGRSGYEERREEHEAAARQRKCRILKCF